TPLFSTRTIPHLLSSLIPQPPKSTLFPYTTLFRSKFHAISYGTREARHLSQAQLNELQEGGRLPRRAGHGAEQARHGEGAADARSEEHTSELQSLAYLVCRLLLEKKKKKKKK